MKFTKHTKKESQPRKNGNGKIWIAAVLLAVLPVNALASDAEGIYRVKGAGASSCGTVIEEYKDNSILKQLNHAWLLGYITAVNRWYYDGEDIADRIDNQGLYAWALKYCREHPLNNWADAAEALVQELERR